MARDMSTDTRAKCALDDILQKGDAASTYHKGALDSSNGWFNNMDGLRCSSSLGQERGYTSCPRGDMQARVSPSGSRSLHTSCSLSAPVANCPLSPYLPLKKTQLSLTFDPKACSQRTMKIAPDISHGLPLPSGMDKPHRTIRSALFSNAPFVLRGALGCSNASFNSMYGLRCSSSLGQERGHTPCPLGAMQPRKSHVCPSRSRSLHPSCRLSAPVANRLLSSHLPLKKPQLSATCSISHRIFGVALGAAIISVPLATKLSLMFDV